MKRIKYETKTEFYECDCHDRDDMIIARRNLYLYDNPEWNKDMDITLDMITSDGDWQAYYGNNIALKFLYKTLWRIKNSIKLLVTGKIIRHGCWNPARIDYETENLVGVSETRRLGQFLVESADKIEEFYKLAKEIKEKEDVGKIV